MLSIPIIYLRNAGSKAIMNPEKALPRIPRTTIALHPEEEDIS
jgi:hypothetical protein